MPEPIKALIVLDGIRTAHVAERVIILDFKSGEEVILGFASQRATNQAWEIINFTKPSCYLTNVSSMATYQTPQP